MAKKKARKTTSRSLAKGKARRPEIATARLLGDLRQLIEQAREQTARAVNSVLVAMYWRIGTRIREDVLHEKRAEYGEEIVSTLSRQLAVEYGRGFDRTNLSRMVKLAEYFPDEDIVATLSQQLSWSHFRELLPLDDPLKREFYAEMCRVERWSVRTLRQKIDRMLFERTAVSKKPEQLIEKDLAALRDEDRLTPDLAPVQDQFPWVDGWLVAELAKPQWNRRKGHFPHKTGQSVGANWGFASSATSHPSTTKHGLDLGQVLGVPRSVLPRLPRPDRRVRRKGCRGCHFTGTGDVHPERSPAVNLPSENAHNSVANTDN